MTTTNAPDHEPVLAADTAVCDLCDPPRVFVTDGESPRRAAEFKLRQHKGAAHRDQNGAAPISGGTGAFEAPAPSANHETRPTASEPPRPPRRWPWQRKPQAASTSKERRPRAAPGRRQPAHEILGDGYGLLGTIAEHMLGLPLTAAAIHFNEEPAGYALDEIIKGTAVDAIAVQPLVRLKGKYDQVGSLFEVPILMFLMERDPSRIGSLGPKFKRALRRSIVQMGPAIKKMQEDEAKIDATLAELYPELEAGEDRTDALIRDRFGEEFLFYLTNPPPAPAPAPEGAVQT